MSTLFFSYVFFCLLFRSDAIVPANETFRYVNEGAFNENDPPSIAEYDATYRNLPPFTYPFSLCFYNTTPNAYTLALRMGTNRLRTTVWVWDANRGKPVRENATLSLGSDGNLVLAEADGQVVWQTNTANKGVVGFAILPDGNVVLRNARGNFVWQSFDYPTDTILVGQTLRVKRGPTKLVSRDSVTKNVNGVYSLVIEPKRLALYYKNTMRYWSTSFTELNRPNATMVNATLRVAETEYIENSFHELQTQLVNAREFFDRPSLIMGQFQYNSSLSYLRLGIDGNLKLTTFRPNVRGQAFTVLYTLFDRSGSNETAFDRSGTNVNEDGSGLIIEDECQLPNRCGKFGVCENSQCVGCPTPNGVLAWSKDCNVKSPGCKASRFKYYELKGVDHFTVKYTAGSGPVKRNDCESKCTKDCKCMGYFYHTDRSRCWIAYELKTLTRVGNSASLAYIKTPVG